MKNLRTIGIASVFIMAINAQALDLELYGGGPNRAPGMMLDFTSSQPGGLRIHRWHVSTDNSFVVPIVQLWYRQGTYVGHESSASGWILHDEKEVIRNQPGNFNTLMPFDPIDIPDGETYGIFLVVSNHHPHTPFVSGLVSAGIPPALPTYIGSGLRVDGGTGRGSISESPGNPFGTTLFPGFMLAGQIGYATVPEPATSLVLFLGIGALIARRRK